MKKGRAALFIINLGLKESKLFWVLLVAGVACWLRWVVDVLILVALLFFVGFGDAFVYRCCLVWLEFAFPQT